MGRVVRDGASNAGLDWADALDGAGRGPTAQARRAAIVDHVGAYGCNMSIRAAA